MTAIEMAKALATALAEAGSDTVFGMPGGGNNLDFIGAAEACGLRFILAHAETNAVIMASVYGDLTGRPTSCVVTRGPGAASAVNGVANALLDRQAVVLVADAVDTASSARILHQQLDQLALFRPVTKWAVTLSDEDPGDTARAAIALAMSPPRGPVLVNVDPSGTSRPAPDRDRAAGTVLADGLKARIAAARRPVLVLGTGARDAAAAIRELVRGSAVPVLATYRAKGLIPESWPNAAGVMTGAVIESPVLHEADLIVFIGVDTVEFIPNPWPYEAPVIALAEWPEQSAYLTIEQEVVGELRGLVTDLHGAFASTDWSPTAAREHRDKQRPRIMQNPTLDEEPSVGLTPARVVSITRATCPPGTIATVDAGAHMLPAMELWDVESHDEILISSGLATMGYSLPAAIGAAFARPDQRVIAFIGDGGLGMCAGELETLARYRLGVSVVVFNDRSLSLIAVKANPSGHGGENATSFTDVDFAGIGRAYGLNAHRVSSDDELVHALRNQMLDGGPGLIDVQTDPRTYRHLMHVIRGVR